MKRFSSAMLAFYTLGACGGGDDSAQGSAAECEKLELDYETKLAEAKQCALPAVSGECDATVLNRITCACETRINVNATETVVQLEQIREKWTSLSCDAGVCGLKCAAPQSGSCAQGGNGGDVGACGP